MLLKPVYTFVAAAVIGIASSALAKEDVFGNSAQYDACMKRAGGAISLHECTDHEFDRLNGVLNGVYMRLLETSVPPAAGALLKAERIWIDYRDAECEFVSAYEQNGLGIGLWADIYRGCRMEMTASRARQFAGSAQTPLNYHSPAFDKCRSERLNDVAACVNAEAAQLDNVLNGAYRSLLGASAKRGDEIWRKWYADSVRKSERAWLKYRDAECAWMQSREVEPSGLQVSAGDTCRLLLLANRIQELLEEQSKITEP